MSYQINPHYLATAFEGGELNFDNGSIAFIVNHPGEVVIRSGRLVATDPFTTPDASPLTRKVPCGGFPVELASARFHNSDERIAYARLVFSEKQPVRWELAVTHEQDPASLSGDEYYGFAAKEGAGCFMDEEASHLLRDRLQQESGYFDALLVQMSANFRNTRAWLSFLPDQGSSANVVCFTSGWGEGFYPAFFGLDAEGEVTAVVIDFMVIPESTVDNSAPEAVESHPDRAWWKFWKS